ncbi:hypothetical protein RchiOBHm_Chr6g0272671 [Rosa chinensis]|uniref:Uncharacterized protein n=1 Tax=Rosa chinensis TaxID=74649 RepID=A0A2P6PRA3_ROSCH|nr:hypothetical protein RchiOBHm_Chr6g0272671 [Rosa chinensis]
MCGQRRLGSGIGGDVTTLVVALVWSSIHGLLFSDRHNQRFFDSGGCDADAIIGRPVKLRSIRVKTTLGSGEALLRGQVKTLLQQVEEEASVSKFSFENRPFRHLQGLIGKTLTGLLAPTLANTPQVNDLLVDRSGSNIERPSPLVQEQLISQVVCDIFEGKNQGSLESQKSIVSRSLLLDFSEKSEISFSSK